MTRYVNNRLEKWGTKKCTINTKNHHRPLFCKEKYFSLPVKDVCRCPNIRKEIEGNLMIVTKKKDVEMSSIFKSE